MRPDSHRHAKRARRRSSLRDEAREVETMVGPVGGLLEILELGSTVALAISIFRTSPAQV